MEQLVKSLLKNARPTTSIYNKFNTDSRWADRQYQSDPSSYFQACFYIGWTGWFTTRKATFEETNEKLSDSVYQYIFICMTPPKNKATKVLGYNFFKSRR